jgi:hypothetical protein
VRRQEVSSTRSVLSRAGKDIHAFVGTVLVDDESTGAVPPNARFDGVGKVSVPDVNGQEKRVAVVMVD